MRRLRRLLQETTINVSPSQVKPGEAVTVSLNLQFSGYNVPADLYLAIRYPDGVIRFLPNGDTSAAPILTLTLSRDLISKGPIEFELPSNDQTPLGRFDVGAALFVNGHSPGMMSNCYWAATQSFEVTS